MGKPTGFMDYDRQLPSDRAPLDRIKDFEEFHECLTDEQQRLQGARCMDCGIPFCHMGLLINGAASGCPVHNLIPEFNDLAYRGLFRDAYDRLRKTNNFPEFTGRVCPAPCEGACTVGLNLDPVTIKNNECFIIDKAYREGWVVPQPPAVRTGKRVAVIGSGPAGLACADQLNHAGHSVTVFERADRIGGLLMYGIPNMKLDKTVVQRRVDLMAAEGIEFRTGVEVGKDLSAAEMAKQFDATVICAGATQPRDLAVEGRNLAGVHFAIDFLRENTKKLLDGQPVDELYSAAGKDVLVIGGGDTGTDCVGTSIRQGCRSVRQIEIMPRPALGRTPGNPWPQWPTVLKTDYGQQEAIAITGEDPRIYLTTVKRLEGDADGNLKTVHTIGVQWERQADGRLAPVEQAGSEQAMPAQLVLLAMGFLGPESTLPEAFDLQRDARSNIQAPLDAYTTSRPGVFSAGDSRRGQSLVVWAIYEGRGAAKACDEYLMGRSALPK